MCAHDFTLNVGQVLKVEDFALDTLPAGHFHYSTTGEAVLRTPTRPVHWMLKDQLKHAAHSYFFLVGSLFMSAGCVFVQLKSIVFITQRVV